MPRVSSWLLRSGSKAKARRRRYGGVVSRRVAGPVAFVAGSASSGGFCVWPSIAEDGKGPARLPPGCGGAAVRLRPVDERGEDVAVGRPILRLEVRAVGAAGVEGAAAEGRQVHELGVHLVRVALEAEQADRVAVGVQVDPPAWRPPHSRGSAL